jgi:hypothetical protein
MLEYFGDAVLDRHNEGSDEDITKAVLLGAELKLIEGYTEVYRWRYNGRSGLGRRTRGRAALDFLRSHGIEP